MVCSYCMLLYCRVILVLCTVMSPCKLQKCQLQTRLWIKVHEEPPGLHVRGALADPWILGGIIHGCTQGLKALPHRQHIPGNGQMDIAWAGLPTAGFCGKDMNENWWIERQNPHLQTCKCLHPCEGRGDDRGTRRGEGCGGRRSDLCWKSWSCFVSHWMPLLGFQIWFHIQDLSIGILIANMSVKRQCFPSQISLRFFGCFEFITF